VLCYQVDLTADKEVRKIADLIQQDVGHLDMLIHSAGVISFGPLESAPIEEFDRQYRTNVRAPYALTQALLPLLRTRRGQIVFINSSAGLNASAIVGQYAATKHALKAVADSFRKEVNAEGLRVLSIYPGRTASPMQEAVFRKEGRKYRPELLMQPEDLASVVINALTLPRSAEITDINVRPLVKS
jgi:NADP-dependent 3-hydroxy acid dehydrogenase YdfG